MAEGKKNGSLSRRLATYIVVYSTVFAFISTAYQLYVDYSNEVRHFEERLEQVVSSRINTLSRGLWLMDRERVELELQGIMAVPSMQYIELKVIDDLNYKHGELSDATHITQKRYPLVYKENGKERELGQLLLVGNLSYVTKQIRDRFLMVLVAQLTKTLLIASMVLFLLRVMVTRHLERMAEYARNLTTETLTEPLVLKRDMPRALQADEFTDLEQAINRMRANLLVDIRKRKQAEEALSDSHDKFQLLYNKNPSMYFTVSFSGDIVSVNEYGAGLLGYTPDELSGKPIGSIYKNGDVDSVIYVVNWHNYESKIHRRESCLVKKDGTSFWVRESARAVATKSGNWQVLMVAEDISEARELSNQLRYQARHDALTGLLNRNEFEATFERYQKDIVVNGTQHALLYMDLDQFKLVNDTCGHAAGDELLRQLSDYIKEQVRDDDVIARLGGDEFGLLINDCSEEKAKKLAENLCKAVGEYQFFCDGNSYRVGASIGMVMIDHTMQDFTQALKHADAACYMAKDLGRGQVKLYQNDDDGLNQRFQEMQWVARIESAIEQQRFELFYQPIVHTHDGEQVKHYEILVRLRDESNGYMVPPNAFLPSAERYNLVDKLDITILEMTLKWLSINKAGLQDSRFFAINLSGQSIASAKFGQRVLELIEQYDVDPSMLCFEITETSAITHLRQAKRFISMMRKAGCQFALDDFGSGLSSFGYLKSLDVDYVKIDGLFVREMENDPIDRAMIQSIYQISSVMGKQVIAEFVENEAVLAQLQEIGVKYAQGYLFGEPEPISNLLDS